MLSDAQNADLLPPAETIVEDEGIDLLALTAAFVTEWRLAIATFVIVTIAGIIFVFTLKSQYVATATILPESAHVETDTLAALFSPHSSGTVFTGLLRSRSVANDVIDRAHLLTHYHTTSYADARAQLASQSTFDVGPDEILTISVKDPNAQVAAMIANAYLAALDQLDLNMAQEQSRQMQSVYAQQLEQEKADLFKAEDQLEQTQQHTGLIQPEAQTQIGLNAIANTRQQIVNLQVQLASMLQSETEQNPQVQRLRSEISQLQAQESAMEHGRNSPVGAAPPAGQLPQQNLDFLRAQREVNYHNGLVNSLASQYEAARLSGNLDRSAFQVIDRAVVPERKSWPPRRTFLLVVFAFAILVALFAVAMKLLRRRIANNPEHAASLQVIRAAFARR